MKQAQNKQTDQMRRIIGQIATLSKLLGMVPSDEAIRFHAPMGQDEMALSGWLGAARDAFLELSVSIGRELDIQLQ